MEVFLVLLGIVVFLIMELPVIFWIIVSAVTLYLIALVVAAIKNGNSEDIEEPDEKILWVTDDSSEIHKNKSKKHNGKCNGDCANCPPHYGYRYGRWYYGHDHVEGCQFGGNKCSGGRD